MWSKLKRCAVRRSTPHPEGGTRVPLLIVISLVFSATGPVIAGPGLGHALTELPKPLNAPSFSLQDTDGNTYTLKSLRGRVILLNFWATWCPPCRREMPSMERLYQRFREEDFLVLAVNQWEDPDQVFAFMGQLDTHPSFPILFDPQSTVSAAYGVKGLPTTFLVNKQGQLTHRAVGGREFDHPAVEKIIRELLDAP